MPDEYIKFIFIHKSSTEAGTCHIHNMFDIFELYILNFNVGSKITEEVFEAVCYIYFQLLFTMTS